MGNSCYKSVSIRNNGNKTKQSELSQSVKVTKKVKIFKDEDGNKVVNKYTLIKTLGRGSYSKVKLCTNDEGEMFAMKILNRKSLKKKRYANGKTAYNDIIQEISILKTLNHPNIVKVYEIIDDPTNDQLFIVLEECGEKVGDVCHVNELKERSNGDIFKIIRDVLEGLVYLHGKNIFHSDIKPSNLLINDEKITKISDFGVSVIVTQERIKHSKGTPSFQPPEVFRNDPFFPFKVDMYALGVTLYVLTQRKIPFNGNSFKELSSNIKSKDLEFHEETNELTVDFIKYLMERDPNKRPTAKEAKNHDWIKKQGGLNVEYKVELS